MKDFLLSLASKIADEWGLESNAESLFLSTWEDPVGDMFIRVSSRDYLEIMVQDDAEWARIRFSGDHISSLFAEGLHGAEMCMRMYQEWRNYVEKGEEINAEIES